ncbi:MarR family transcriptional regulator [Mesorhizobium sp. M7D.F.Ca.US.004.03.1.1]|uniref:MarR family transcriptional regulator n=2 Tax=Phyllobacteriaceae TaxID=69277 RepID=A0A8E3B577_RHILI|nr:MarR family transcriptional regulator [Mesorhizobium loti]RUX93239.1 MarR family transcriptional regulator [Mesorhizobium sp. M7D.F.Ca.US.004.01.2.1]RVA34245.1 MarR family transcriptional regulator [Mesorhizobium sp. M7D.F.Ca.US.004.03.1.1]
MQISFALYGAAGRMARMHKPFLDPLSLTFPQYLVMLELYTSAPRTVGDLGNALGMDTGTITPLLKRLETCGMVTRMRDPEDERRVLVDLTPAARSIQDAVWSISGKIKSACQMSEDEIMALRDTLHHFAHPAKI